MGHAAFAGEVRVQLALPSPPRTIDELLRAPRLLHEALESRQRLVIAGLHSDIFDRVRSEAVRVRSIALALAPRRSRVDQDTLSQLSPTIFREGPYRFFFFSLEEDRVHVHVVSPDGEAKFWLEPIVALATSTGFSPRHLRRLQRIVEERQHDIRQAWNRHFER